MPRRLRLTAPGGVYHVTSRGNRGGEIYLGDGDRLLFLDLLGRTVRRRAWELHAFCLMDNHYHLVLGTPRDGLSQGLQYLNGAYAQWFNQLHGYTGHVFQGRFHSGGIESEYHFLEACRYVALNPVRAGLCLDAGDWEWSSYRWIVTGGGARVAITTKFVEHFGTDSGRARERLMGFVADGLRASESTMAGV
jgi:putative transposase